ncbi:MAG: PDZ domain-containing protein [Verrucomicrobiales bacterium]|nr:PDZ domain-containing protein [Verrucomicrobiales bacterium]
MHRWSVANSLLVAAWIASLGVSLRGAEIHVSPAGQDSAAGSATSPLRTLAAAQSVARKLAGREPFTVTVHAGTYYLDDTLRFSADDSGTATAPMVYRAADGEAVTLSGGMILNLAWSPHRDGILKATVPGGLSLDQLFVNGQRQPMARYPNFDPAIAHFNGYAADAFAPARAARWSDPRGGFIHAMHRHEWGDFHYLITGKSADGSVTYEGGWQNNRRLGMHDRYRMVENVFEELDAPGEWFHDPKTSTLYFLPPAGVDPTKALFEGVRLRHLIEVRGTADKPVHHLALQGFMFRHTARTFMDNREPLLRSDWTTYRGGAVVFEGTEDCRLEDATLDQLGGNAVFVNFYNRRLAVARCLITGAGANGIAFVGDPKAVRSPLFEYEERQSLAQIDRTPGPLTSNYPADCLVEDCLITLSGRVEKQTAPVQIAMAQGITVRHCSLYDVPRAGINIGDGCWGGHVIEHCDIFDTVKETGDHGSFNSWGRDRYWGLKDVDLNAVTLGDQKDLPLLDMVKPTILRNNRWRCDHGWDIDLDDGSSNYEIRNNLCLNGGIKLREGFHRVCENNIMVNNSFHPHVWYKNSQDVFRHNIVFSAYCPIQVPTPWGKECDGNLLHRPGAASPVPATQLQSQSGRDARSIAADALFIDAANGDYGVKEGSPALALGFRNFPMNEFGVRAPRLKALARTPALPSPPDAPVAAGDRVPRFEWRGAVIKDLSDQEFSVVGVAADAGGVFVERVPPDSQAEKDGLQRSDLIRAVNGAAIKDVAAFSQALKALSPGTSCTLRLRRNQFEVDLVVSGAPGSITPRR